MIHVKRIYDQPEKTDGYRILVDRLWPRGLSKDQAKADVWLRDIAPSDKLRRWFSHDPNKWKGFQRKYNNELKEKSVLIRKIKLIEKDKRVVTLLFSARDEKHNNVLVISDLLKKKELS